MGKLNSREGGGRSLPVGVCIWPEPGRNETRTVSLTGYLSEVLGHFGLAYSAVAGDELAEQLDSLRILVTIGPASFPDETAAALRSWVDAGGSWISIAETYGMPDLFGVEVEARAYQSWGGGDIGNLGEGYLEVRVADHPILAHVGLPLHYYNGIPVRATDGTVLAGISDAHQRATQRAALVENLTGTGRCILIAPDLTGTVVRIQQGISISRDRVPADDGTAPVSDGLLKADDGSVLDWIFDRQPLDEAPGFMGFLEPVADLWKELLLRSVLYAAERAKVPVPLLWLYPDNLPALCQISLDSDGNDPALAAQMLELLVDAGVPADWCIILPGYDVAFIKELRENGQELATHFDFLEYPWGKKEFDRQWKELTELFGGDKPITNKNHFLRWQGDMEFFEWCYGVGLRFDQTKGATKTGAYGFPFGSCHMTRPMSFAGEIVDVYELPTPSFDYPIFAPLVAALRRMDTTVKHHGVFHLLHHPANIGTSGVAEALRQIIDQGHAKGLQWWTGRQLVDWEDARRDVQWSAYHADADSAGVTIAAGSTMERASVLMLGAGDGACVNGDDVPAQTVERWGFTFSSVTFDASAGESYSTEYG